ncbi:MAG: hypothetical protein LBF94_01420 [Puniceicoccales bacterium]|jgi:septal ring factor EnvC (AmiA/AmiB activator)|nr:hypothetical protein [Puniceicoccales bacterium]
MSVWSELGVGDQSRRVEQSSVGPGTSQTVTIAGVGKSLAVTAGIGILKSTKELYARVAAVAGSIVKTVGAFAVAYPAAAAAAFVAIGIGVYCGYKCVQHIREVVRRAEHQKRIYEIQSRIDDIKSRVEELGNELTALEEGQRAAADDLKHLDAAEDERLAALKKGPWARVASVAGSIVRAGGTLAVGALAVACQPLAIPAVASIVVYWDHRKTQHLSEVGAENARRAEHQKQIGEIQSRIDGISSRVEELGNELTALEEEQSAAEAELEHLEAKERERRAALERPQ